MYIYTHIHTHTQIYIYMSIYILDRYKRQYWVLGGDFSVIWVQRPNRYSVYLFYWYFTCFTGAFTLCSVYLLYRYFFVIWVQRPNITCFTGTLLALLVIFLFTQFTCFTGTKRMNADAAAAHQHAPLAYHAAGPCCGGTQFTCFTGIEGQILTQLQQPPLDAGAEEDSSVAAAHSLSPTVKPGGAGGGGPRSEGGQGGELCRSMRTEFSAITLASQVTYADVC